MPRGSEGTQMAILQFKNEFKTGGCDWGEQGKGLENFVFNLISLDWGT